MVRCDWLRWPGRITFYCASDDGCLHCLDAASGSIGLEVSRWAIADGQCGPAELGPIESRQFALDLSLAYARVVRSFVMTSCIWPLVFGLSWALSSMHWMPSRVASFGVMMKRVPNTFANPTALPRSPAWLLKVHWVATQDALIVPGGRSVPAPFWTGATGALKYFELNAGGKGSGGSFVAANDKSWFVHTRDRGTREFALDTGLKTAFLPNEPVLSGDMIYAAHVEADQRTLRAYKSDSKEEVWQLPVDATGRLDPSRQSLGVRSQERAKFGNPNRSAE